MTHTVLLVDDDANILYALTRMLQKQPFQLYTARSAEEAMFMLKAHDVDVLVTEEKMPGISGGELLAWVADNYPDVMRIVLTGHASVETAIRAINEGGVYYFFTKPCNEAHLAIVIRKALERKDMLQENSRLLELNRHHVRDLERFALDLEILTHIVARDLQGPLQSISQSCQSLLERYQEMFDCKARSLIDDALEAVADVRAIIDRMSARTQSLGRPQHVKKLKPDQEKAHAT